MTILRQWLKENGFVRVEDDTTELWLGESGPGDETISVNIDELHAITIMRLPTEPEKKTTIVKWSRYEDFVETYLEAITWP